jgi:hypothetical protein
MQRNQEPTALGGAVVLCTCYLQGASPPPQLPQHCAGQSLAFCCVGAVLAAAAMAKTATIESATTRLRMGITSLPAVS